jgi:hypothetical protein
MSRYRVIADTLNIRAAPTTEGKLLGTVARGTDVLTVEPGPWRFVVAPDGTEGWVHGGYLVEAPSGAAPAPQVARYRTAASLLKLLDQVNALAPKRKKGFDGTIGDAAHQARKSDHNPNADGVVTALDVTHDPPAMDALRLANALRASRDPRIKYVIHNGRIFSSKVQPWVWRPYSGADPHKHHVHVSVEADAQLYDNAAPWKLG